MHSNTEELANAPQSAVQLQDSDQEAGQKRVGRPVGRINKTSKFRQLALKRKRSMADQDQASIHIAQEGKRTIPQSTAQDVSGTVEATWHHHVRFPHTTFLKSHNEVGISKKLKR